MPIAPFDGGFQSLDRHVKGKDERQYVIHAHEQLLRRKMCQLIAGYPKI